MSRVPSAGGGAQGGGHERRGKGERCGAGASAGRGARSPRSVGDRGDAEATQPGRSASSKLGGQPALRSQSPQAIAVAGSPSARRRCGEGVEEGVGGGVVALAGVAQGGRRSRSRGRRRRAGLPGQLVQVPGGVGLRGQRRAQALGVERLDEAVVERPGGVEDRAQGVLGGDPGKQRLDLLAVGDVAGDRRLPRNPALPVRPPARSLQRAAAPRRLAKSRWRAPCCFGEMAGGEGAEAREAAGDEHGALGVEGLGRCRRGGSGRQPRRPAPPPRAGPAGAPRPGPGRR